MGQIHARSSPTNCTLNIAIRPDYDFPWNSPLPCRGAAYFDKPPCHEDNGYSLPTESAFGKHLILPPHRKEERKAIHMNRFRGI